MTEAAATILYIDDDEGLRQLTRRALERRGHRVSIAASCDEGVARAAVESFDLVAVDHYMPDKDGLQTLMELQQLPSPPPVIFVTGSDESQLAVAALKAGAIDYILKTTDANYFDLLGKAVERALRVVELRRQHSRAEQQLRESNERLQVLLQEVNHRVANSLQLVSSFIRLQARGLSDASAVQALEDTDRRVAAIAKVHRRLYSSSTTQTVDMADYLESLVEELGESWSTRTGHLDIQLSVEPSRLLTDQAVAVGVIVNELVTNACKYAYELHEPGSVRVRFETRNGAGVHLTVEDDGCGMPSNGEVRGTGLGTRLVAATASSLQATVAYQNCNPGMRATVSSFSPS